MLENTQLVFLLPNFIILIIIILKYYYSYGIMLGSCASLVIRCVNIFQVVVILDYCSAFHSRYMTVILISRRLINARARTYVQNKRI